LKLASIIQLTYLFRAFLPNWSFFDSIGKEFKLEIRFDPQGKWIGLEFSALQSQSSLLFNAHVNLLLATIDVVEHFATDVQRLMLTEPQPTPKLLEGLTSYRLVQNLIHSEIKSFEPQPTSFQFKLIALSPSTCDVIFISHWLKTSSDDSPQKNLRLVKDTHES
jgi:hypothetical protein